jgi:hypothetical protein
VYGCHNAGPGSAVSCVGEVALSTSPIGLFFFCAYTPVDAATYEHHRQAGPRRWSGALRTCPKCFPLSSWSFLADAETLSANKAIGSRHGLHDQSPASGDSSYILTSGHRLHKFSRPGNLTLEARVNRRPIGLVADRRWVHQTRAVHSPARLRFRAIGANLHGKCTDATLAPARRQAAPSRGRTLISIEGDASLDSSIRPLSV